MSSASASGPNRRPRPPRVLLAAIAAVALVAAGGGTYLGLRNGGTHKSVADVSASAPLPTTTTLVPPAVTTVPTTAPATTSPSTVPPTTAAPTTAPPTTTPGEQTLPDTTKPVAVAGGSFVVISGEVTLTHVVVHGDTLFGLSQWFKLMGGVTALYEWNHSIVGSNPNLIFPGQVLTIRVPGADIPKISPMYLADTQQAHKASV